MTALQTPTPGVRHPGGTPVDTSVGPARLLQLTDGRWAVVSDQDLFLTGVGDTPSAALSNFEQRVAER